MNYKDIDFKEKIVYTSYLDRIYYSVLAIESQIQRITFGKHLALFTIDNLNINAIILLADRFTSIEPAFRTHYFPNLEEKCCKPNLIMKVEYAKI